MVLPTLEKEADDDPYGYLTHTFNETLLRGGLVVAIGTSLRDKHLVSALEYNSEKINVLVIDTHPEMAISRMPKVASVPLKVNTSECLSTLSKQLVELAERCTSTSSTTALFQEVQRFAHEQETALRDLNQMSEEQKKYVTLLNGPASELEKIEALGELHGLSIPGVVAAVSSLLVAEQPIAIRKAAAGCLGLSGSSQAAEALSNLAILDNSPDVRLESYLALQEIGSTEAINALESAKKTWPDDPFFYLNESHQ